jgi:hypothetical protein
MIPSQHGNADADDIRLRDVVSTQPEAVRSVTRV